MMSQGVIFCNFRTCTKHARAFSLSTVCASTKPTNLKGKSTSSQRWLLRQFKDPYVHRSKLDDYRARSAYKLLEINEQFGILRPGSNVLDLGAAPGSWTQVAVTAVGPDGHVVAVDKDFIVPIEGAVVLERKDFTAPETRDEILSHFPTGVDVLMSDMAPSASGLAECDHERIVDLSYQALVFAAKHMIPGGSFLTKVWAGKRLSQLQTDMEKLFGKVHTVKPDASRDDSGELFVLGVAFKNVIRRPR